MHGWLGNKIILRTNDQNDKIAKKWVAGLQNHFKNCQNQNAKIAKNGWLGYKIMLRTAK